LRRDSDAENQPRTANLDGRRARQSMDRPLDRDVRSGQPNIGREVVADALDVVLYGALPTSA
jgi:hypothetical protein